MTTANLDADLVLKAAQAYRALSHSDADPKVQRIDARIALAKAVPSDERGKRRMSISLDDFMLVSNYAAQQGPNYTLDNIGV